MFKDDLFSKFIDFTVNGKRKLKGYNTGAYIIEFVGKDYAETETVEQRFNRLQMEIAELEQDIQNGGVSIIFFSEIENINFQEKPEINMNLTKEHIQMLSKQLEKVKIKESAGVSNKKNVKAVKESKNGGVETFNSIALDSLVISDFEARLDKLEQNLGIIGLSNPILTSGSVAAAIDDLKTRVDSLNSVDLESIETRLNKVMILQSQSQEKVSDEFTTKVNELYGKIVQIENSNDLLDGVVLRLRTLAKLHEQGTFLFSVGF